MYESRKTNNIWMNIILSLEYMIGRIIRFCGNFAFSGHHLNIYYHSRSNQELFFKHWLKKYRSLLRKQGPITRSVHLHCIRDPTYAQIELFLDVFPANFCLHCGPYMTEINAELNDDQSEVPHPSSVFLNLFALISAICGRRQTFARNNSKNSSIWASVVSQT